MVFTTYHPQLSQLPFVTLSRLAIKITADLPVVIASLLAKILSLRVRRNNMLSLNLTQRQNITLWLLLQLNYIGSGCYFMILVSLYPYLLCYVVITLGLLSLHPIYFFMHTQNMWRYNITSSMRKLLIRILLFIILPHKTRLLMFLKRGIRQHKLHFFDPK
jgi:hypothetical protein